MYRFCVTTAQLREYHVLSYKYQLLALQHKSLDKHLFIDESIRYGFIEYELILESFQ